MKTYTVVVYDNGTKEWFLNGNLHREDGPAAEWANGTKFWYIDDKQLTEAEFNNRNRTIVIDGKSYRLVEV